MRFLADENVAPRTVSALQKEGLDVRTIYDEKLSGASDKKILDFAKNKKRIVLTPDKDFGGLIRKFYQPHYGVILIRLRDQSPQNVIKHLISFLKNVRLEKIKNRLVIFQEGRIRII